MGEIKHGVSAYSNIKCRCDECRSAWAKYTKELRSRRASKGAPAHGLTSTYTNWACRCADCKSAHAAYARQLRAAKVS